MKCKICGAKMKLKAEDKYEIPYREMKSLLIVHKCYEAFNCKECGCQNIVNIKEVDYNERLERVDE